jgi:hypothetical protein
MRVIVPGGDDDLGWPNAMRLAARGTRYGRSTTTCAGRWGKKPAIMGKYGTPNIDVEESWIEIVHKGRKEGDAPSSR